MSQTPNPYKPDPSASQARPENPFSPPADLTLPKRSTVATVAGWIFAVLAVLIFLTGLRNLFATPVKGNPGYLFGEIFAMILMVGIPALIAYLCLTSHTRKAKKSS